MNYYFTGILVVLMLLLATCVTPGYARNEYLNNGSQTCQYGSIDLSISKSETEHDYRIPSTSDYDNDRHELRLSFRKNLGVSKKLCDEKNRISLKNEQLKQQIELYKVCKGVRTNKDPLPQFADLMAFCSGIKPFESKDRVNPYKSMIENIKWKYQITQQ